MAGSSTSPGRGQRPRSLRTPSPTHQVGHLARGAVRERGQNWGRARPRAPSAAPGDSGGVSYLGRGGRRDFGRRARAQLRAGTLKGQPSASGIAAAACPSPAAECGGTERGFEGRLSGESPRVPSAFTGGGGSGCCYCYCCWPSAAAALVPAPAPPPAAAAAASSPPFPSPLRRLLQRPLTRPDVILPLRNPAQPSPPALPVRTPTSPPLVLTRERVTSPPCRLASPIACH